MSATGTPTPNIGLRIPLGTDPASVDDINYNSNLIDTKLGAVGNDSVQDQIDTLSTNTAQNLGKVQDGLAIVANGNTHVAIPADYYVYVKGHNSLSEGLYKNTSGSTIAANATLSTSNLTADDDGGLNSVYSTLNSNFTALIGSAHIYRDNDSKTTYSFTLSPFTDNSYKAGLLIQHDAWNPCVYLISLSGGESPQYCIMHEIYKKSGSLVPNVSVKNKTMTVTFETNAYGGCSLIWLN